MIFLWHFPGLNKEVIKDLVDSVEVELNESWPVSANKKWSEHSEKTDVMRGHSLCPLRWKRHFQISLQLHRKVSTVRSSWVLFYCSFGLICATKSPSWTLLSQMFSFRIHWLNDVGTSATINFFSSWIQVFGIQVVESSTLWEIK